MKKKTRTEMERIVKKGLVLDWHCIYISTKNCSLDGE